MNLAKARARVPASKRIMVGSLSEFECGFKDYDRIGYSSGFGFRYDNYASRAFVKED